MPYRINENCTACDLCVDVCPISQLPPHAVNETRDLRINTAREFYKHPEHIDWRRLGLLEIFEGSTFKNLTENPTASVLPELEALWEATH